MNGFEVIQENVNCFICEKKQAKEQIAKIEERRIQLAEARNIIKKYSPNCIEVSEFGKQISELGNQSQELQNKLDSKFHEVKTQINFMIDNLVAEGIRKIRIISGEIKQLENKIEEQKARKEKYQLQKEEFYLRFGRMPELSERAVKESELQEKEATKSELEINQMKDQIAQTEAEISILANAKKDFKNGNWNNVIEAFKEEEEFSVEELNIEEIEPIEEFIVEEFGPVEEMYVEEFQPVEEIKVEVFDPTEDRLPELEELAKAIVEEIVEEQTKDINVAALAEKEDEESEEAIVFEKEDGVEECEKKGKVTIPLFGTKPTITNIIVKFEEGQLVYKAKMTDNKEVKIHPANIGEESVILRDKQNRAECKEILTNYAVNEYKIFDKKVIDKIDPLVCELLIECAERYSFNAQELMYDYAMSFATGQEIVPGIIYNMSYIGTSNLSKKEKAIVNKICRHARKVNGIDIIEPFAGFKKFKYLLKRLFAVNNVNVLPEAKY